jgi:hypothetical protein
MTADEGRKLLGLQPYSDRQLKSADPADKLWQPVNMVYVTKDWAEPPAPAPVPGKGAGQGGDDQDGGVGGSKPATPTSQGGKRSTDAEIRHYFVLYSRIFSDAFGRIRNRTKPVKRDYEAIFTPVLSTIAAAFELAPDREPGEMRLSEDTTTFLRQYIADMAQRAPGWTDSDAAIELRRAITVLREHCSRIVPSEEETEIQEEEHVH